MPSARQRSMNSAGNIQSQMIATPHHDKVALLAYRHFRPIADIMAPQTGDDTTHAMMLQEEMEGAVNLPGREQFGQMFVDANYDRRKYGVPTERGHAAVNVSPPLTPEQAAEMARNNPFKLASQPFDYAWSLLKSLPHFS